MAAAEIGGGDPAQMLGRGVPQHAGIDQPADLGQQAVLSDHVGRLEQRAGKHALEHQPA